MQELMRDLIEYVQDSEATELQQATICAMVYYLTEEIDND